MPENDCFSMRIAKVGLTSGNFVKSMRWSCLQNTSGREEAFNEALEFYDKGFYE